MKNRVLTIVTTWFLMTAGMVSTYAECREKGFVNLTDIQPCYPIINNPKSEEVEKIWNQEKAVEIHVSPDGNDRHAGTISRPLRTLQAALAKARKVNPKYEVEILLHQGSYELATTLEIHRSRITNNIHGNTEWLEMSNNWSTNQDPGFIDPEHPLKGFRSDAPVYKKIQGFTKIPVEEIGCKLPETTGDTQIIHP